MRGVRLDDLPIGGYPGDREPGSYWRVMTRDGSRPLNVLTHPEDRKYWSSASQAQHDQNLTGGVWGVITPNGLYGMLSIHTVREQSDGNISVLPGDGSSNSILIEGIVGDDSTKITYHGYIYHGEWREC